MNLLSLFKLDEKYSIDEIEEKLEVFRKYQLYMYVGITLIVIALIVVNLTIPSIVKHKKEQKTLSQYSKVLEMRKKKATDKKNVQEELEQLTFSLNEKKELFFSEKEVEKFSISTLQKIAIQNGIQIGTLSFKKPQKYKEKIKKHDLSFNFNTDFFNLMSFIYTLENDYKALKIGKLSVSRKSINPVSLGISMTITLFSIQKESI